MDDKKAMIEARQLKFGSLDEINNFGEEVAERMRRVLLTGITNLTTVDQVIKDMSQMAHNILVLEFFAQEHTSSPVSARELELATLFVGVFNLLGIIGVRPDLNFEHDTVRNAVIQVAEFWRKDARYILSLALKASK